MKDLLSQLQKLPLQILEKGTDSEKKKTKNNSRSVPTIARKREMKVVQASSRYSKGGRRRNWSLNPKKRPARTILFLISRIRALTNEESFSDQTMQSLLLISKVKKN